MIFKGIINLNRIFCIVMAVFVIAMAFTAVRRKGKDLKVGLYGVMQVLHKGSPYDNPNDPPRAIYRYAPGFAILQYPFLLKSKMIAPFEFENITPSILAWYFLEILVLLASAFILIRIIPSASYKLSARNLKISFLMALPLIGYELANGQNKLLALFFILAALLLFENRRFFSSAIFFSLALTVYSPLFAFIFYFIIRSKGKYLFSFTLAALLVFFVIPSLFFGYKYNLYLLNEWFVRSLKPFFLTNSYSTYIDLRRSSQSLPSTVGRLLVSGETGSFNYRISPIAIHFIIRFFSALIVFFSCFAVWKRPEPVARGLHYAVFLILALVLPQYCIYYTWAYLFVFYFAMLNYLNFTQGSPEHKKILLISIIILFISSYLTGVHPVNYLSNIFWSTMIAWLGIIFILVKGKTRGVRETLPRSGQSSSIIGNLSVLLIAHNEEQNIKEMIQGLLDNYQAQILEIIVVDDASTDKTPLIVEEFISHNTKVKLIRRSPPCGVGRALKTGFANISSDARYILSMDSDFLENIKQVRLLIRAMEGNDYDGVIGSRFIKGGSLRLYPLAKRTMNRLFHFVVKTLFDIPQKDLSNNFKLYKAHILKELPWKSNTYAMNAETGILPVIAGYNVGEVPVIWSGRSKQMGKSKFNILGQGWGYIKVIIYALQVYWELQN